MLLVYGECVELEDEEYISLSSILEGLVILCKVSIFGLFFYFVRRLICFFYRILIGN